MLSLMPESGSNQEKAFSFSLSATCYILACTGNPLKQGQTVHRSEAIDDIGRRMIEKIKSEKEINLQNFIDSCLVL